MHFLSKYVSSEDAANAADAADAANAADAKDAKDAKDRSLRSLTCLPALIQSASASPLAGKGPIPISPFSLWSSMLTPSGRKLLAMVGIPIPRLTYIPSLNSFAARRTILPLPPVTTCCGQTNWAE